jgi:type IV pilus assembly protein PilY1
MNWLYDDSILSVEKTRMTIAQEVVTSLIESNPIIDFGLAVFNSNGIVAAPIQHGGRIVKRIIPSMTDAQRTSVTSVVDGLTPETWTPLCESTYEAYRYMAGQSVKYGLEKASGDTPDRDTSAETGIPAARNTYHPIPIAPIPTSY